ncbi:putative methyltransferase PMT10 [Hibiscus syriacus]|uniref:Methyltransferase n=1 Tax=Hibiscus syriacus TaxID=106335 RepID=A0A6A3B4Q1_HIBSY|nr:putative methyltransferase PMT10 [Hibiscus syriacus]
MKLLGFRDPVISNVQQSVLASKTALNPPPPPPPPEIKSYGIVDENGTMSDEFEIGEFDPDLVEDWGSGTEIETETSKEYARSTFRVKKFGLCDQTMREYVPCLDNMEAIKSLKSTMNGERFERHCPEKGKGLNCLVPPPKGYRPPIPWPKSRDEIWFSNVPHSRLVDDKGGQNWISRKGKDKFKFPGGGTQFIHGADQYLDQMSKMVPEITFGHHIRVALDVGCGVASFGAYLLSRNVITMSVAPKDVHENQIQFALERGVPAMVAAFATRRLLYPSQAFDLIHCSRCRINWTRDDGILLLEVNRMLRAGGYFAWAAQPVYKHKQALEEMLNLTTRLCWNLVKKEGYVDLKACISRLPENGYGANVAPWPARLQIPPDRLQSIHIDSYVARKELFKAESKYWNEIVASYVRSLHWKKFNLRNVMDMRASFGGFASALIDNQLDAWVLNVVPVSVNHLILTRGPMTFCMQLASFKLRGKDVMSTIMLEMDWILRPGAQVYIYDSLDVMDELQNIAKAMGWHPALRYTSEGPHASYRVLACDKRLLRS